MRLKLHVQYNGNGFYGWQSQHNPPMPTIEGELLNAFQHLTQQQVSLTAAGRTDAGVHAIGQVVHTDVANPMPLIKYLDGLNHFLPKSIRIQQVDEVDESFHARFSAKSRTYRYLLAQARHLRPDLEGRVGKVQIGQNYPPLNLSAMQTAMESIGLGPIDFSALRDAECQSRTPICNLLSWSLTQTPDPLHGTLTVLEVTADHFLHHMVRNLVGMLVAIGRAERTPQSLAQVLATRDRRQADVTFSPHGLYLTHVGY